MASHSLIYTSPCPYPHHPPDPPLSLQLSSSAASLYKQNPSSLNFHYKKKICNFDSTSKKRVLCAMAAENKVVSNNRMLVFVPPHPLIKHWVSILRNEQTPCPIFKNAMAELGRLLMYEASRDWLPTISGEIQSPMGVAAVEFIDPREPVAIIPILRAGLALSEHAASVLPATKTYHLGVSRNEETLQPTVYLNKLPDKFPEGSRVIVVDPMLATGGTIVAAIDLIKERGVGNGQIKVEKTMGVSYDLKPYTFQYFGHTEGVEISRINIASAVLVLMSVYILCLQCADYTKCVCQICAVAAPPALQKLSEKFPGLHIYAGILDPTVDEKGFIIPGLGDAGDRSFGTSSDALS